MDTFDIFLIIVNLFGIGINLVSIHRFGAAFIPIALIVLQVGLIAWISS